MIDPQHKLLETFISILNVLFSILKNGSWLFITIIIFVIVVAVILFLKSEKRNKHE